MSQYEKAVAIMLLVTIAIAVVCLIYSCCLCLAFCCKSCFVSMIPILVFLALVVNVIVIIVYVAKKGDSHLGNLKTIKQYYGYSFYLAGVGAIGLAGSFVLALILTCTSKVSPI